MNVEFNWDVVTDRPKYFWCVKYPSSSKASIFCDVSLASIILSNENGNRYYGHVPVEDTLYGASVVVFT